MSTEANYFSDFFKQNHDLISKLIASLVVILILIILKYIVLKFVYRRTDDVRIRYTWRKSASYIVSILGILILGRIWFVGFQSLTTYLGLVSAGIAIALKDPLVNMAAWVFIIWRRPFTVGDRVEIGSYRGDVIDLRLFQFTLMEIGNWVDADQSTGRVIQIPNGKVFTEMLANYSKGFRFLWNEVGVLVTYESDWQKAKEILLEIATRHSEHLTAAAEQKVREASARLMIFYRTLTPTVYTSVKGSGIMLTIRYLCEPRNRRGTEQAMWEDILTAFAACDNIDFAYPTQRFYDNVIEGKPGARAKTPSPPEGDHQADRPAT
jgi:small-conductance mechanosensitive channel